MKARFTIKFSWNTHAPPSGFTSAGTPIGEGQGGAGFARGEVGGRMLADGAGAKLSYDMQAVVGGRCAQIDPQIIISSVKGLAD